MRKGAGLLTYNVGDHDSGYVVSDGGQQQAPGARHRAELRRERKKTETSTS